jgi:hypothetical protein
MLDRVSISHRTLLHRRLFTYIFDVCPLLIIKLISDRNHLYAFFLNLIKLALPASAPPAPAASLALVLLIRAFLDLAFLLKVLQDLLDRWFFGCYLPIWLVLGYKFVSHALSRSLILQGLHVSLAKASTQIELAGVFN